MREEEGEGKEQEPKGRAWEADSRCDDAVEQSVPLVVVKLRGLRCSGDRQRMIENLKGIHTVTVKLKCVPFRMGWIRGNLQYHNHWLRVDGIGRQP